MICSTSHRRIASNLLLSGGEFVARPIIEVDERGRILSVEQFDEGTIDRMSGVEFYNGVMVAGFVNAHCHTELSYLKGEIEPYGGFATFASKIGQIRNLATESQRLDAIAQADAEMYRGGVVAVGDIVNGSTSFECKARSAIEYVNFAEVFGLRSHDTSAVDELLHNDHTSLTPHSLYSLNDDLFRDIASQPSASPLSIHFMESEAEQALYDGSGRLYEWYQRMGFECDFLHYGSPAERLVALTPPDRSVMLVHNCCVTQRDIEVVMNHFTAPVYWVVCPRSNDYISRLTPPLELLRANNLNICVGTDSLSSNWSLSMVEELRAMDSVPLAERLDWATRQGATALNLDNLGSIEVGKCPGVNILSGVDYSRMELTPKSSIRRII